MITATNVSKRFDSILAVDCVSTVISQGAVFGLIGSNGAGKSTFLRLLAGVLKPDQGEISVDGQPVYDSPDTKRRCFFISDEQYFFQNATPETMKGFYKTIYPSLTTRAFTISCRAFPLTRAAKSPPCPRE